MEIFKLFGSIFVDSAAARDSISRTGDQAEGMGTKLGKGIKSAAKWGAAIGAAAIGVGVAMFGAAGKIAEVTDEIDKASRRAGTTAENWQKLNYAFGQSGIESSKLEATMIKNQKALNEAAKGSGKAADAYETLGVSIKNTDGSLKNADEVYQESLKSLADLEDINLRNSLANDLFGKSYGDLAPLLDSGSEGIDALTSRAEQLGLILSQETVDAGVLFGDTLDDIKQVGGAVFNMIAAELLPVLQAFLDWVIGNAPAIQETVAGIVDFVSNIVAGFKEFWKQNGDEITAITSFIFEGVKTLIEVAMEVIKNVIEIVMGIITGDWSRAWEGLKGAVSAIFDFIKSFIKIQFELIVGIIKGVGKFLFDAGKELFNNLWEGIKSVWESISSWVSEKVSWIADKLMFWNNSKDEMDEGKKDGSHASGLAYVPYDGYMAELHRGERVVNAQDNKEYSQNQGGASYSFTFNSPKTMSPAEAAKQSKKVTRELLLGF